MTREEAQAVIDKARKSGLLQGNQIVAHGSLDDLTDDGWLALLRIASRVIEAGKLIGITIKG